MSAPSPDATAIVDYDCMCSLGETLAETWCGLAANRSGIGLIDRFDVSEEKLFGVSDMQFGGQIPASYSELAGSDARLRKWPEPSVHALREVFGRVADRLSFQADEHDAHRLAVLGGTALTSSIAQDLVHHSGKPQPNSMLCLCQNIPLSALATEFGLRGPLFSIGSACASSGHALLLAAQLLEVGSIDLAVVCGFEFPFVPVCAGGFVWLNAVYQRDNADDRAYDDASQASRPFSSDRRGFLLAEGVGIAAVTSVDYARRREWPIKAVLRGGHMNSDAAGMTKISSSSIQQCMREALRSSETDLDEVGCINAHATSTPLGDAAELIALQAVFGRRLEKTPVVANKSQVGHSLGASSILEVMFAAEGMNTSTVLPTLNHRVDSDLPPARIPATALHEPHDVTLLNAFGFGGTNISLVIEKGFG